MKNSRRNQIREKVEVLLAETQITQPPVSPLQIARHHGIQVKNEPIDDSVSGFIVRHADSVGVVIGINSNQPKNRQRFTLAHELGHYFLHNEQGQEEVHVDGAKFVVKWRDGDSSKGVNKDETEANQFAAELLMPAKFLEADITRYDGFDMSDDDDVAALAKKYGVSTQAMTFRLSNLHHR